MSNYLKQLEKINERIEEYWNGETIDVDLANQIVDDCSSLLGEVYELRLTIQSLNKSVVEWQEKAKEQGAT